MDYSKLKVVELKEELKNRGLSTSGLKKDLVQRLTEADAVGATEANESTEEQVQATEPATENVPAADASEVEPTIAAPESGKGEVPSPEGIDSDKVADSTVDESDRVPEPELKPVPESEPEGAVTEEVNEEPQQAMEAMEADKVAVAGEAPEQPAETDTNKDSIATAESNQTEVVEEPSTAAKRKVSPEAESEDTSMKRSKTESGYDQRMAEREPEATKATDDVTKEEIKDEEKTVEVEQHPNVPSAKYRHTNAVYMQNFSRPLNIPSLKAHLESLAGSRLSKFWIDSIRTHCYAVFESVDSATKAREDIYGQTFPLEEKGRKKLIAEYIPESKVDEWIAFEESDQGRLRKWEVAFGDGSSIDVNTDEIKLIEAGTKPQNNGPSFRDRLNPKHTPLADSTRGMKIADSTTADLANVKVKTLGELFKKTNAKPSLYYCEAPEEVVRERLRTLRQ
ncbi:hypothetical protein V1525DRAFT_394939 [Lipomyces kononenkoae]|uniref:Uncharacterized protein n=1 Tax=Lipomyces kononenkoae TaxID=34357 RepID=A0ACC3T9Y8_LIPKO